MASKEISRLDPQVHAEDLKAVIGAVDSNACSGKVNAPEVSMATTQTAKCFCCAPARSAWGDVVLSVQRGSSLDANQGHVQHRGQCPDGRDVACIFWASEVLHWGEANCLEQAGDIGGGMPAQDPFGYSRVSAGCTSRSLIGYRWPDLRVHRDSVQCI